MLDPLDIGASLVGALRDIPELLPYVNNDPTRITLYDDGGAVANQSKAIYEMKSPGILVLPIRTDTGRLDQNEWWQHVFQVVCRTSMRAIPWLVNGVPASGDGLKLLYAGLRDDCLPFSMIPPPWASFTDENQITYFVATFTAIEKGDN
jgi:hypothetical protein